MRFYCIFVLEMNKRKNNITSFSYKNIFVIILLSMIIKPLHSAFLNSSDLLLELEVIDFNDNQDQDLNQDNDTTEDDLNEDEEDLKMLHMVINYSFSFSKSILLTQEVSFISLVQETLLPPPDLS